MPQDANRPLVFGSQLIGVLVVILTLVTRQAELRSTRPVGDKKQIAAELDQNRDYFARLWDDPLAQLSTFQIASQEKSDAVRFSRQTKANHMGVSRLYCRLICPLLSLAAGSPGARRIRLPYGESRTGPECRVIHHPFDVLPRPACLCLHAAANLALLLFDGREVSRPGQN